MITDIDERTGWPDELKVLLEQYPRSTWRESRSPMAQFWLEKHEYFRQQSRAIDAIVADYRDERKAAEEFAAHIVGRLQSFLSHIQGHHQIEDYHYFPAFRAAEQRLARGFDVLASDHELLHKGLQEIVETVNAFLSTLQNSGSGADTRRHAADRYIETHQLVMRRLLRHLDDEEDLIIPLMLDRG